MRMESMLMIDALPSEKGHADSTASVAFASSSPRWHSHLPDQLDRPDRACAEPAGLCDASNPCEQHSPRVGVADVLRGVLVLLHQRQDRGRLRRSGLAATLLRDRFGLVYRWRRWVELTSGSYFEVVLKALLRWARRLVSLTSGDRLLIRNHLEVPDQRTKPSGQPFTRLLIPPRDSDDSLLPIDAKVQWESCPDTVCESNSLTQLHNLRLHQANLLTEDREPKIDTLVL